MGLRDMIRSVPIGLDDHVRMGGMDNAARMQEERKKVTEEAKATKLTPAQFGTLAKFVGESILEHPEPRVKELPFVDHEDTMMPWEFDVKRKIDGCCDLPDYSPAFEDGEHAELFDALVNMFSEYLCEPEREDEDDEGPIEDGDGDCDDGAGSLLRDLPA